MKKVFLGLSLLAGLVGCVSKTVETDVNYRKPTAEGGATGVGDIDSSTDGARDLLGRYRLPIERDGETKVRVAYTYWSGEWPQPIADVSSKVKGSTVISGYPSPRVLKDRKSCQIKNGIYHPWSEKTPSLINYYSFMAPVDFQAKEDAVLEDGKKDGLKVPKGAKVTDVVPLSEGWVSGTLRIGKGVRVVEVFYSGLYESKSFVRLTPDDRFNEQWLHLECAAKDANGKSQTIFVEVYDLMNQNGVSPGTFDGYGKVKSQ
ncbi:hypothetical protein [Bdellovibrio sp. HCB288]|uniref:hypothetical protein n=1 Tax=Bdellovibrio sp. HCB288 TaxID=3394355 RepID=UPI0039B41ACD